MKSFRERCTRASLLLCIIAVLVLLGAVASAQATQVTIDFEGFADGTPFSGGQEDGYTLTSGGDNGSIINLLVISQPHLSDKRFSSTSGSNAAPAILTITKSDGSFFQVVSVGTAPGGLPEAGLELTVEGFLGNTSVGVDVYQPENGPLTGAASNLNGVTVNRLILTLNDSTTASAMAIDNIVLADAPPPSMGSITIVKDATPADGTDFDFALGGAATNSFTLDDAAPNDNDAINNSVTFDLPVGDYTVAELLPVGWDLQSINCQHADSILGIDYDADMVYIDLAAGDDVTCTFVNSTQGSITIVKDATPADGTDFAFALGGAATNSFTLDDAAPNDNDGIDNTVTFDLPAGDYSVAELLPASWDLQSINCQRTNSTVGIDYSANTLYIDLAAGDDVTCTFRNIEQSPAPGKIKIVKDAQPNDAQDFAFTTTGRGLNNFSLDDDSKDTLPNSRTFTGLAPGSYSVTERATPGWTLTGLTCTDPSGGTSTSGSTATINLAASETVTCTFTNAKQTVNAPAILISSNENGNVPGMSYRDEDIIGYDPATNRWSLIFDGSDVGLNDNDIDDFVVLPNGDILLSLERDATIAGFGPVGDEDVLRFIPTRLGTTTAGSYQLYLDGSDVGLEAGNDHEDIKSVDLDQNGRLVVSMRGSFNALGVTGDDEDLLTFQATSLGNTTSGTWSLRFDGSDIKLTSSSEDLRSIWLDNPRNDLYITTDGNYAVTGSNGSLSGDGNDIFICTQTGFGPNTTCKVRLFRDMGVAGMGSRKIDGLYIGMLPSTVQVQSNEVSSAAIDDDPAAFPGDDADEPEEVEIDEEATDETASFANKIFLPFAMR